MVVVVADSLGKRAVELACTLQMLLLYSDSPGSVLGFEVGNRPLCHPLYC
jgi:hypothetical protein